MAAPKPPQLPPGSETLKYQTWVLKVLIHCDGCTKRIKKILQGIEGVYTTEVDSTQHKVTVTGNVEAETLIKKLSKSGKSVELWPQKPPEKKDKKHSTKSNEDQKNSTEPVDGESSHEDCIDDVGDGGGEEDSNHNDSGGGGDNKSEGGAKKKKKKKKKNKSASVTSVPLSNNDGGEKVIISTEKIASPREIIVPPVLQQQHGYNNPYPPHMYYSHPPLAHAPPPYGLSYNTSYPVSTTSAYYVGAPIMPMHANYSRVPPPPPPPSDPINNYGYHHDHDEYEGGYCSIM
ncbi:unnamed protein product [Lathyrus sativus]|nr:unnamed protein product [Lathyrus sativus]